MLVDEQALLDTELIFMWVIDCAQNDFNSALFVLKVPGEIVFVKEAGVEG